MLVAGRARGLPEAVLTQLAGQVYVAATLLPELVQEEGVAVAMATAEGVMAALELLSWGIVLPAKLGHTARRPDGRVRVFSVHRCACTGKHDNNRTHTRTHAHTRTFAHRPSLCDGGWECRCENLRVVSNHVI